MQPTNVLEKALNTRVSLLLKDNRIFEGKLIGYDEHMNFVLEDTEEFSGENVRRLGLVIVRGSNVVSISPKS